MTDKNITNWYKELKGGEIKKPKLDSNFTKHHILPCSMILCIGGTGSGKSNALIEFLSRKNNAFYDIIIFSGSTTDEPLYNLLEDKIDGLQLINDIEELPELSEFDDDEKDKEKLIVFDDFINLSNKEMKKIKEYLTAGRKCGFTCWLMAQNYTSVPKTITRNCHYFIIFKLNDNATISNIIRNHNVDNLDKEVILDAYNYATKEPLNFLMVDTRGEGIKRLRRNFTDFINTGGSVKSNYIKSIIYDEEKFKPKKMKTKSQYIKNKKYIGKDHKLQQLEAEFNRLAK
jgi:Poxvirus A32 protein